MATASAVAQAIAMNPQASIPVQTSHNLIQSTKVADPEPFNRNQDQTNEFIRAIRITVTMQADTFVDERMKILYALSFMHRGTAQVWAVNKTMAATSQMQTLVSWTMSKRLSEIQIRHSVISMSGHLSVWIGSWGWG